MGMLCMSLLATRSSYDSGLACVSAKRTLCSRPEHVYLVAWPKAWGIVGQSWLYPANKHIGGGGRCSGGMLPCR